MPITISTGTKPSPRRNRLATTLCTIQHHQSTASTSSACNSSRRVTSAAVARVMMKNDTTKTRSKKTSNLSTRAAGAIGTAGPSLPRRCSPSTGRVSQRRTGRGADSGGKRAGRRPAGHPPWPVVARPR